MPDPTSSTDPTTPPLSDEQCRDLYSEFHQNFRQTFLAISSFPSRFESIVQRNQLLNEMAEQIVSSICFDFHSFEFADQYLLGGHHWPLSGVAARGFPNRYHLASQHHPIFRRF